ncbi:MAG: hypothetical protein E5X63_13900, partial [Mesorhizobium sp.]
MILDLPGKTALNGAIFMSDSQVRIAGRDTIRSLHAELPVNATFHIWLKATKPDVPGSLSFSNVRGKFGEVSVTNAEEYEFR